MDYRPGSQEDFDRLYRDTYPRLLRTLFGVLGDAAAAEDCVQDAFVRAYRAWPNFKADRPAAAWLHRIALNVAISYRRKARLREAAELLRRLGRPESPKTPSQQLFVDDIVRALAELSPKVSSTFILRHYHGYTNREIARALGVTERMVGVRLSKAREHLARRLGAGWAEPFPTYVPSSVSIADATDA
jgi:RNA polymerase sigma-70 factor (ECF subfamily)